MRDDPMIRKLLEAILPHVAFEGWSDRAFAAAAADAGMSLAEARALCPRRAVDLAVAWHHAGDAAMRERVRAADLSGMRFREKVAFALRARLEAAGDREALRRSVALFSLPHLAPTGARLVWATADAVWDVLGDRADDINWYTKRATLSAVWSAVVLYWLGDDSLNGQATDEFIARRIGDVMRFEEVKSKVQASPLYRPLAPLVDGLSRMVRPPPRMPPMDMPGWWGPRPDDGAG